MGKKWKGRMKPMAGVGRGCGVRESGPANIKGQGELVIDRVLSES